MSTNHNNGQLAPKENPECASLEKDSKTNTDQKNTQQNNLIPGQYPTCGVSGQPGRLR